MLTLVEIKAKLEIIGLMFVFDLIVLLNNKYYIVQLILI